eukprot:gnl/Chilomastix_caulleri/517.p3 GENE.gnl/Chilomastix_caulleri/517~~gnl/Chilomastix_caulleri/517.p3  ORF type:complete len:50 (-),score=7.95 gnl/Chilomastix_caulleri/517:412-561(-)
MDGHCTHPFNNDNTATILLGYNPGSSPDVLLPSPTNSKDLTRAAKAYSD